MIKYFDNPGYNAAFERCIVIMAALLEKYGPQLLNMNEEADAAQAA